MITGHKYSSGYKLSKVRSRPDYLDGLSDFDSPYFVIINSNSDHVRIKKVSKEMVLSFGDDLYLCMESELSDSMQFFAVRCDTGTINEFARALLEKYKLIEQLVHVAVFHHNCLGAPHKTFQWSVQLLEQVVEESDGELAIGINDYLDRENWHGVEYTDYSTDLAV